LGRTGEFSSAGVDAGANTTSVGRGRATPLGRELEVPGARQAFRVMERSARVCRTMPASAGELSLEVIIVEDDNRGNWGEKFVWRIE